MDFRSINIQRKAILISSVIGIIALFLPWATVSMMGMSDSVNGFRSWGILVFFAFVAAVIISLMGDQSRKLDKKMWLAVLIAGTAALLFTIISFGSASNNFGGMGLVDAGNGIGIWLALLASIAVLVSAWYYKNPGDNIRDSFEALKRSSNI